MSVSGDVERTAAETEPEAALHEPELQHHPEPKQYIVVAIALAVATGLEVGLYYITLPSVIYILLLAFFATIKFILVALWFMHLRFDSRIFRRLFVLGIVLAISVYVVALLTFGVFLR